MDFKQLEIERLKNEDRTNCLRVKTVGAQLKLKNLKTLETQLKQRSFMIHGRRFLSIEFHPN